MKTLYKGEGFQIVDDDGVKVFKIDTEASEILYSFLTDAINEYERASKKEPTE